MCMIMKMFSLVFQFKYHSFLVQEKEGDKMPQYEIKPMVAREASVSEKVRLLYLNLNLYFIF